MDAETFKKIIEYYGEENIIGIGFDNSAGVTFASGEFSMENIYVEEINCLQIIEFDRLMNPYHVIKHVENVQAIMVRDSGVKDINAYDRISIRG